MVAGVKVAKKAKVAVAPVETDSESELSANGMEDDDDDQHLSDEEFPMSADEYDDDDDGAENDQEATASKWALTMAKYLRKGGDAKILSKASKEVDLERKRKEPKPSYQFEVVGEEVGTAAKQEDVKEEKPADVEIARELLRQKALIKKERLKDILGLRVRPSIGDYDRERALKKIATKGTVQLFNAVRQQQKDVNQKLADAGKLEYKREKVLKNLSKKEFLNALMNGPRAKSELVDNLVKKEEDMKDEVKSEEESGASDGDDEPKSTWGALRADFLSGKKSGWDKEQDEESDKGGNLEGNMGGESSDSD
ncbi:Rrp15 protein [Culex quinquefasciatus]|uniref:RRP15-like protein n=1 Tax=Culex quinquefasciatus TaxID=7176 RepID=B0X4Q9_CULQU|nr:Rrp15 protein [Culex quinquefasciatus]|eukprot:XP_001864631.1 Rrp15 protein [Culex quinquefasciatus]